MLIQLDPKIFDLGYQKSKITKGVYWKRRPEGGACLTLRNVGFLPRYEQVKEGPLFFFKPNDKWTWQTTRARNEEMKRLDDGNIKFRFWVDEDLYDRIKEGDGYCRFCKKDFQDKGRFCSIGCERSYKFQDCITCDVCFTPIVNHMYDLHHIRYDPEETIIVCRTCHVRIHHSNENPHLRPPKDDIDKFYQKGKYKSLKTAKPHKHKPQMKILDFVSENE